MAETSFWGKASLEGKLKLKTGLHIGGSQAGLDIGGVDNNVIKTAEGKPYIPGSSLKGKLRSLLERLEGKEANSQVVGGKNPVNIHMCENESEAKECPVCSIFGTAADKGGIPGRLIVRDAYLNEQSLNDIKEYLDLEWTEVKFENVLDRITSRANPRQMERVPPGAVFDWKMSFTLNTEDDIKKIKKLTAAFELLEEDYLGGNGTRGYGQVEWKEFKLFIKSKENYLEGVSHKKPECKAENVAEFKKEVSEYAKEILEG